MGVKPTGIAWFVFGTGPGSAGSCALRPTSHQIRENPGLVLAGFARSRARGPTSGSSRVADLNRQLNSPRQQRDRLLNLRLLDEIDESKFAAKSMEVPDRISRLSLNIETCDYN
jgi:hypothetical protein